MMLFGGAAPRVFTAPASADLLGALAAALRAELSDPDDPLALSRAVVLMPNRRMARALTEAFAEGAPFASLLPAIRPIGDLDDDVEIWGADPEEAARLPPAIDPLRRRIEIAALVRARDVAEGGVPDPVRALAMADALCAALDAAAAGDPVDWARLPELVADRDLARHWRRSAEFLRIITEYWPARLAAEGLSDPAERRVALVRSLARRWRETPPSHPVVVAGSTGSVAATRELMAAVAHAPRGCVVLPGLDRDLDADAWEKVGPQHPQWALKQSLAAIAIARGAVLDLPGAEESRPAAARRALVREALAPAEVTADWLTRLEAAGGPAALSAGLDGMALVEAETPEEEASVAALALREALEIEGRTAALVTPNAAVAARIAARLARFGVRVEPSAGRRLSETPAGVLTLLALDAVVAPGAEKTAALLAHPCCALDWPSAARTTARRALERAALRGVRRPPTDDPAPEDAARLEAALIHALAPLRDVFGAGPARLDAVARALTQSIDRLTAGAEVGEDHAALAALLDAVAAHGDELADVTARDAGRLIEGLMAAQAVPPSSATGRVQILGPFEARLARVDVLVLAGLDEGVWPAPPPEDPFLSRPMRADLALPAQELRIGLAAHDFAQLACAPRVLLLRAKRRSGAPTVASRWVWRLVTLLRGAGLLEALKAEEAQWLAWARALDAPQARRPAAPPRPRPPSDARLTVLSVTEVERLVRDPYAVYARRILGLRRLDGFAEPPDARHRGTAIHAALEAFGHALAHGAPADPDVLLTLADAELERAGFAAERRIGERSRLEKACAAFAAWAGARRDQGVVSHLEARGGLRVGDVSLSAVADRIDLHSDGRADLVDYKTGAPPTKAQVQAGFAPQLPLEAVILQQGGFKGVPRARPGQFVYWRIGGLDRFHQPLAFDRPAEDVAREAYEGLVALLTQYAAPTQPFLSRPRVFSQAEPGDYDQLARRQEWADAEGEE